MALIESIEGNTADSTAGISFTSNQRVADPFTPANLTLVEAIASTTEAWAGFWITVGNTSQRKGVITVTTGAASSEVRIASLPAMIHASGARWYSMYVPIPIAAGTRLAVGASTNVGDTLRIQIAGIPSSNFDATPSFSVMDCGPFVLANDFGTYGNPVIIDPGATANTKSAWIEVSETGTNGANNVLNGDSLDHAYAHFGIGFAHIEDPSTAASDRLWDVGIGASGSEMAVIANYHQTLTANANVDSVAPIFFPWDKASGTRIAARMQSSSTEANDRQGSIVLFGVR